MGKKTEQINLAVTSEILGRVERIERKTGIKGTEIARQGLVEVLNRLENDLPPVSPAEAVAITELRALGACPVMALRDKIAEVTRDQFLSTATKTETHPHDEKTVSTPPPLSGADRRHPPANVRVVALRTPARPPLCVGPNSPRRP